MIELSDPNFINRIVNKINLCKLCDLCQVRKNTVPGYGDWSSDIMFIGEAPGKMEDEEGVPFVGASGKILDKLLESISMTRDDVFITNIVKCRPPKNRDPYVSEIKRCLPYLYSQIKYIKPKLIITLGRHSMNRFFPNLKISDVHGKKQITKGIWQKEQVYLPLYHPAASLYDPRKRDLLFDDFAKIPLILKKL